MRRNIIKKYILDVLKESDYHLDSDEILTIKEDFYMLYDNFIKRIKCDAVILYAMYYFKRYCECTDYIEIEDIINDFAVSLMIASKFVDDDNIENGELSEYIGVSLTYLNKREVHIMKTCNYDFYKTFDFMNEFYFTLEQKYKMKNM